MLREGRPSAAGMAPGASHFFFYLSLDGHGVSGMFELGCETSARPPGFVPRRPHGGGFFIDTITRSFRFAWRTTSS